MSKEQRAKQTKNTEPELKGFSYDEFFNNPLALNEALKAELMAQDLDYRFLNMSQFRNNGNVHRSHWQIYKASDNFREMATAEGYIRRGDLVLAVRPKTITSQHKKFLKQRNYLQTKANAVHAEELKQMAKEAGVAAYSKVSEGYEEN